MNQSDWFALQKLKSSYREAKNFLFPFDSSVWARLAVILILSGSIQSGGFNMGAPSGPQPGTDTGGMDQFPGMSGSELLNQFSSAELAGIAVAGLGLLAVAGFIGATFNLVFFRAVEQRNALIMPKVREQWRNGIGLLFWRILIGLGFLSTGGLLVAGWTVGSFAGLLGGIVVALPIWFLLLFVNFSLASYASPQVVQRDETVTSLVIEGLNNLRNEWKQALVYAGAKLR